MSESPNKSEFVRKIFDEGVRYMEQLLEENERLRKALAETHIEGVTTNIGFHVRVLADPEFARGGVDTAYLPRFLERGPIPVEA